MPFWLPITFEETSRNDTICIVPGIYTDVIVVKALVVELVAKHNSSLQLLGTFAPTSDVT